MGATEALPGVVEGLKKTVEVVKPVEAVTAGKIIAGTEATNQAVRGLEDAVVSKCPGEAMKNFAFGGEYKPTPDSELRFPNKNNFSTAYPEHGDTNPDNHDGKMYQSHAGTNPDIDRVQGEPQVGDKTPDRSSSVYPGKDNQDKTPFLNETKNIYQAGMENYRKMNQPEVEEVKSDVEKPGEKVESIETKKTDLTDRGERKQQADITIAELGKVNERVDVLRASKDNSNQQELATLEQEKAKLTGEFQRLSGAPEGNNDNKIPSVEGATPEKTSEKVEPPKTGKEEIVDEKMKMIDLVDKMRESNPNLNTKDPEMRAVLKNLAENPEDVKEAFSSLKKVDDLKEAYIKNLSLEPEEANKKALKDLIEQSEKNAQERAKNSNQTQDEDEKDSLIIKMLKIMLVAIGAAAIAGGVAIKGLGEK